MDFQRGLPITVLREALRLIGWTIEFRTENGRDFVYLTDAANIVRVLEVL